MKTKILTLTLFLLCSIPLIGQDLTQAIRGTVTDQQSGAPLTGATVVLLDSDPLNTNPVSGAYTDENGDFRLENVPIGRQTIQVSYIGYEPMLLNNLMVTSGKELSLEVTLIERITTTEEVVITAGQEKYKAQNEVATVSARSLTMEEAFRYSGTLNDVSRMAQNFAGVSGASDDRNDIIIRGNSPTGVLWQMEGISIPSPNHFATLGTTGGPVSMLNPNNLANSDFITSAFPAEYGNALAGVFDLKLRNGNKDKYEFLGQIGFNGFEFGVEGPFSKQSNASFLANYRYSTLGVFDALGVDLGTGSAVPYYQDLTFKINVPTKKAGTFSVFGVGGFSNIDFLASEDEGTNFFSTDAIDQYFTSGTGIGGFTHKILIGDKTVSKLKVAVSATQNTGQIDSLSVETGIPVPTQGFDYRQNKYTVNYKVNHKFNAKNKLTVGLIADVFDFYTRDSILLAGEFRNVTDYNDLATLIQGYGNWQHRFSNRLTMNLGLHYQRLLLNDREMIEPRLGMEYSLKNNQSLSLGVGLHSQMQPVTVYFLEDRMGNLSNQELDFTKSLHIVAGYNKVFEQDWRIKAEAYYQYIYDAATDSVPTSFSMLNEGAGFVLPNSTGLVNDGIGRNYGVELTIEKFFSKGFYFLSTTSLFNSEYQGSDEIWRNTNFNTNLVTNLLAGYEIGLGKNKNSSIAFDTKVTYAGGRRYTPIDLEASRQAGAEVLLEDQAFSERHIAYFRPDVKITYRLNMKKFSQMFSVDLQNFIGRDNIFLQQYNPRNGEVETTYQRGFFPNVTYQVLF